MNIENITVARDAYNDASTAYQDQVKAHALAWSHREIALQEHGDKSHAFKESHAVWQEASDKLWSARNQVRQAGNLLCEALGIDPSQLKEDL